MRFSPILLLHIGSGIVSVLAGALAAGFRKGSRRHGLAGNTFVISMLSLSLTGVYLAVMKSQPGNILGGTLTFYLVATAWIAARHRDESRRTTILDWASLLLACLLATITMTFGIEGAMSSSGLMYGDPASQYFFLGSVAVLATAGDVRLIARGGITGSQRIARHLWRMCFAFFIASASIFLARAHLFPEFMRKTGMLYLLSFAPLLLMACWLIRIRLKNAYEKMLGPRTCPSHRAAGPPLS